MSRTTEIAVRRTELVPRTRPAPPRLAPPVRGWLRELVTPAPLHSYLAPGEPCRIVTRRHWAVPLWRLARGGGMMTAIGVLTFLLPGFPLVQVALALGAVAHAAWIGWCILDWRLEQIAVTDTRLIRVSGILSTTVDIVPLSKITDMTLRHSIPGRVLGYGQLRVETAGQQQAVGRLDFIPAPGAVYRAML